MLRDARETWPSCRGTRQHVAKPLAGKRVYAMKLVLRSCSEYEDVA
jgi:hypothetical protein